MTFSRSPYGRPWPSRAARCVLRGSGRALNVFFRGLAEIGYVLAGVPAPVNPSAVPPPAGSESGSGSGSDTGSGSGVLDGPPPGHPERLVADACLSPGEMELWCMLGGLTRWPV